MDDLDVIRGDWEISSSKLAQCLSCNGCCCLVHFFVVNAGCVRNGKHSDGRFLFFGEGVHVYKSPFVSLFSQNVPLTQGAIVNGTRGIITVEQGFIGLAMDRGQPVLLPPGLHQWNSPTIEFVQLIDLAASVIKLGPYTLLTVDEGYSAVTQDNGEQKILEGGRAYMLTHRNWKFEKFMTKKLQTNDVGPVKTTTGDNVTLEATATVNWLIEDVKLAARMAANTMAGAAQSNQPAQQRMMGQHYSQQPTASVGEFDITKLRTDVLRQVTAALAAFIGQVSYSAHGQETSAARAEARSTPKAEEQSVRPDGRKQLFDSKKMDESVRNANQICGRYGVKILSINLISAYPADTSLLEALSKGAVSSVAAEQAETQARGEAQALLLKAKAEADAAMIKAEGDARADEIRAEGSLKAAQRLETSDLASSIAKLRSSGEALGEANANAFFFGLSGPADMPAGVLGNALMAQGAANGASKR